MVFAGGAAIYWLLKDRYFLAFALALYAAYFGYETYSFFEYHEGGPGRMPTGAVIVVLVPGLVFWNWLGLGAAVAVAGVAEFVRDRIKA
jgi:hypothetical protein